MKKPGPDELPIIGSALNFGKDPFLFFDQMRAKHGDVFQYTLFGQAYSAVFKPEHIEHILLKNSSNYIKSKMIRETWEPLLGRGLLSSDGDEWKQTRKTLQTFMSRDKLGKYFNVILKESNDFVAKIEHGQKIDMSHEMLDLSLFILVKLFFRSDIDEMKIRRFGKLFEDCSQYFTWTLGPGLVFDKFPNPSKSKFLKAVKELDQMAMELIRSDETSSNANMLSSLKAARDEQGNPFTEKLIRDNLLTFFLAGHETSALSLAYVFYILGKHPHELKKVQHELDTVLSDGPLTFELLDELTTLKNVILEVFRLFPPAGIMARQAVGDDEIDGVIIKAGSNIMIPLYNIQRDPKLFPSGNNFNPDQWKGHGKERIPGFLPFGQGSRYCIGAGLADIELQTILATILRNFNVTLKSPDYVDCIPSITTRPHKNIVVEMHRRTI